MKLFFSFFFALLVASVVVINALSDEQEELLKKDLGFFETYLNNSINVALQQLDNLNESNPAPSCSVKGVACNPATDIPVINFSQDIPAEYSYVQIKEWIGQNYTDKMRQTCSLMNMKDQWLQNYNDSNKKLMYQYYTYPDDYVGFYPASPWNCSLPYTPTERPFFVSGATGQRDVIVLIDTSSIVGNSQWRLDLSKKVAKKIVKSLSYRDFVSVISYGLAPDQQITLNSQATTDNVENLLTQIDNIQLMPNNGSNIGAAVDYAFTVFSASESIGSTSRCTKTIVLLSGGDNDVDSPPIGQPLSASPETLFFPILISNNLTTKKANLFRALACGSKSVTTTITDDTTAEIAKWTIIVKYFSKLLATSIMRWSESYVDRLTGSQILSLSAPIFDSEDSLAGVVTLDAPVTGFNQGGNLSDIDINTYNLQNQVCTPLDHLSSAQADNIADLQDGMCENETKEELKQLGFRTSGGGEELEINKAMPGIIVGSVFFILIVTGFGAYKARQKEKEKALIAFGVFLLCWIIALPIGFAMVAPDMIEVETFVPTKITVTSSIATPYRCCELRNCQCYNAPYGTPSCSSELTRLTNDQSAGNGPFDCQTGYQCCRRESYSCNCRRSCSSTRARTKPKAAFKSSKKSSKKTTRSCRTVCSTCYRCVSSVRRRRCQVECGTCYALTTKFFYPYKEDMYLSQWTSRCSLSGAEQCKNSWLSRFPVGSVHKAFVNPENPVDVRQNVEVRTAPFAAFLVFALISIPVLLYACLTTFRPEKDAASSPGSGIDASYNSWNSAEKNVNNTDLAAATVSSMSPTIVSPANQSGSVIQPTFQTNDDATPPPAGGYVFEMATNNDNSSPMSPYPSPLTAMDGNANNYNNNNNTTTSYPMGDSYNSNNNNVQYGNPYGVPPSNVTNNSNIAGL